jgi:hypothetical protein
METYIILAVLAFTIWTFSCMAAYSYGRKSWNFMIERYKKALDKARFRIAELTDGLGGTCGNCKGYGVLGENGDGDCWECGGTGLRSLREYQDIQKKILDKAESDARKVLISIERARKED